MRRIEYVQTLGRRNFATMVSIGLMALPLTVSFVFRPLAFCDMCHFAWADIMLFLGAQIAIRKAFHIHCETVIALFPLGSFLPMLDA